MIYYYNIHLTFCTSEQTGWKIPPLFRSFLRSEILIRCRRRRKFWQFATVFYWFCLRKRDFDAPTPQNFSPAAPSGIVSPLDIMISIPWIVKFFALRAPTLHLNYTELSIDRVVGNRDGRIIRTRKHTKIAAAGENFEPPEVLNYRKISWNSDQKRPPDGKFPLVSLLWTTRGGGNFPSSLLWCV